MQSIDTMSIPQEREEGWGHLSAKSRPGKKLQNFGTNDGIHQNRSVYVNHPFMTTPIVMSMYRSKVEHIFKNGIFQCERLTIATPGSVLHIHVRFLTL